MVSIALSLLVGIYVIFYPISIHAQYPPRPQFPIFTPMDPARSHDWQPNPLYRSPLQGWNTGGAR